MKKLKKLNLKLIVSPKKNRFIEYGNGENHIM